MSTEPSFLLCIPIFSNPYPKPGFRSCELVKGLTLTTHTGTIGKTLSEAEKKSFHHFQLQFTPNYIIILDRVNYWKALNLRLEKEGKKFNTSAIHDTDNLPLVSPNDILRQTIVSLLLTGGYQFRFEYSYNVEKTIQNQKSLYRVAGMSPIYPMHNDLYTPLSQVLSYRWNQGLKKRELCQLATQLDRYYRAGTWWTDRLGMALDSLWNACFTANSVQAFTSLISTLETLVSTKGTEITHILAERVALLIRKNPIHRHEVYKQVKALYKTRSMLV